MESPGHLGLALLVATPVWFLAEPRISLAFVALVVSTAMLPDVDLLLTQLLPIAHHGITHSLLFVVGAALALGALATGAVKLVEAHVDTDLPGIGWTFGFTTLGFGTGAAAHLLGDFLTTPDVAPPIMPFQPFTEATVILDIAYVYSPVWNLGLLAVGAVLNAVLWARSTGPVHGRSYVARLKGR